MSRKAEKEIEELYKLSVKELEEKKETIKNHYCFKEKGLAYYNVMELIDKIIEEKTV